MCIGGWPSLKCLLLCLILPVLTLAEHYIFPERSLQISQESLNRAAVQSYDMLPFCTRRTEVSPGVLKEDNVCNISSDAYSEMMFSKSRAHLLFCSQRSHRPGILIRTPFSHLVNKPDSLYYETLLYSNKGKPSRKTGLALLHPAACRFTVKEAILTKNKL